MSPTDHDAPVTAGSGLAPVNGLQLAYERSGTDRLGATPLVLLHGGYGTTAMFSDLAPRFGERRPVIAVDLQGHGRTGDIDRPLSYEAMADDIAALVDHLRLGPVDVVGYSLGAGTALRTAIQHRRVVRRLVVIATPFASRGWHPGVSAQFEQMGRSGFEMLRHSPVYDAYAAVAPDPEAFPHLMDKVGALLRNEYDWSDDVRAMGVPTMLVYGDADSIPVTHAAEFFALLGGGLADAGWDRSNMPASRLAILPDTTHYDILAAPALPELVEQFLAG